MRNMFFNPPPRLDPIGPQRRLEQGAPIVAATIGGRPVFLARPDERGRRPGDPIDYTVPLTVSRMRRARDIELERATGPYRPSLVDDVPLNAQFSGDEDESRLPGGSYAMMGATIVLAVAATYVISKTLLEV